MVGSIPGVGVPDHGVVGVLDKTKVWVGEGVEVGVRADTGEEGTLYLELQPPIKPKAAKGGIKRYRKAVFGDIGPLLAV